MKTLTIAAALALVSPLSPAFAATAYAAHPADEIPQVGRLITCNRQDVVIRNSPLKRGVLQIFFAREIEEKIKSFYGHGFTHLRSKVSSETILFGEGRHWDWKAIKSGQEFQGAFVAGQSYLTNIYVESGQFFLKLSGVEQPICFPDSDGYRRCTDQGPYGEVNILLTGCVRHL
jgi:hypothetical protein